DSRTVLKRFHLDPKLKAYITCPSCFKLYDDNNNTPCPEYCTHSLLPGSPSCSTSLMRVHIIGRTHFVCPVKKYLYQDMKQWLAWFLSCPDVEGKLESAITTGPKAVDGKDHDIWDGEVLQNLDGPDSRPFTHTPPCFLSWS
ncbi:hypothetical protein EDB19DRAFT_1641440, partial [Suillus lakei]